MDRHLPRLILSFLLLTAALALLSACSPQSKNGADQYFEGNALALAIASAQGDGETISRLIKEEGIDPDKAFARDAGIPLLSWPLRAQNPDGLQALLDNGADPNARAHKTVDGRKLGYNNAMVYAAKMDDPRFLELLLEHDGDQNT